MKAKALGKIFIVLSLLFVGAGTASAQFVFQNYLKPSSSTFPIVDQDHIKGGYHVLDSWAQLNDGSDIAGLHKSKREVGMIVVILDEGKTYVLVSLGLDPEDPTDDIWQEVISTTVYRNFLPYKAGFLAVHENNLYICTADFVGLSNYVGQPLPSTNWVNLGGGSGGDFALKDLSNVDRASVVDTLIAANAIADTAIQNFAVTTNKLATNAVTGAKLNNAVAGSGLLFDNLHNLKVAVDSNTIVFKNDSLSINNGSIQTEKLRSNSGTALSNGTAGQVLSSDGSGNFQWLNSSSLSVNPDNLNLGNDSIFVGSSSKATQMIVGGDMNLSVVNGDSAVFTIENNSVNLAKLDQANISIADLAAANATVDMNGNKIVNVANPLDSADAANFYTVKKQINDSILSRLNDNSSSYAQWWSAGKMQDTLADYPVIYSTGKISSAVIPSLSINTTYVVSDLYQIRLLDTNLDTIIYRGDIAIDTTNSTSYMFIGYQDGLNDTLEYGQHIDSLSVSGNLWVPISFGNVISVNGQQGIVNVDINDMPLAQAEIDSKEDALGNPATNGEVLTSTSTGARSWKTIGSLLSSTTMDNLGDVTDYTGAGDSTILVYDGTNWQAVKLSGDVVIGNSGTTEITEDAVELGTNTTGNYVRSVNDLVADGLKVTGNGEGGDLSIQLNVDDSTLTIIDDTVRLMNGAVRASNMKAISGSLGNGTDGQVLSSDGLGGFEWMNASALSVNPNNITLDSANILIGNASDLAQAQALSGDASIDHNGVLTISDGAVTKAKLASDAVDSVRIIDGSVTSSDIKNGTITALDIADDGVSAAKIDAGIAGAGLKKNTGNDSVYVSTDDVTLEVVNDQVRIKDDAVTSAKISDRSISGIDISQLGATANQQLTWDGFNWVARTDSAIYTGFQDTIGLDATTVQRAIEKVYGAANAVNTSILDKVKADSIYFETALDADSIAIWNKRYTDSLATVAVLSAQRALLFAKLTGDSLYFETMMDQDSLYFESQMDLDSAYLAGLINTGNSDLLSKINADSTAIWNKIYSDSVSAAATLALQRALLFAKLTADSMYYEAQMDIDSTYFDGLINTGSATLLAKIAADSTYFEAQLDADSTALQAELDATQAGSGLGTDGSYTANGSTSYIGGATTLKGADDLLDAAIRVNADSVANYAAYFASQSDSNQVYRDSINALSAAVAAAGTDNTVLQGEVDATQAGAGLGANGTYSVNSTANYINGASSLVNADDLLDAAIKVNNDSVLNYATYISALQDSGLVYRDSINNLSDSVLALRNDLNAFDALPVQAGSANLMLTTDGTTASWDSVRTVAIARGNVTASKLAANSGYLQNGIAGQVLSSSGNGNFYWQDASSLSVDPSSLTLPDGQIYVGNASDQAEAHDITGDIAISNTGVVSLNDTISSINELYVGDSLSTTQLEVSDSAVFKGAVVVGGTGINGITTSVNAGADNDSLVTAGAVKTYVDAVATSAGTTQAELDATQSGAGLAANGAYSANSST
ncbi:beta strand repeat-containing protein, partial [Saccharicrinis sp. FJH54]|uniref:beta strand repeat-containing protein n=1 Tax=Saccharicrinis sp. FJH54 TaxID=3344665 RepID=UPI0035D4877D